jgi:hypothetical protein
MFGFIKRNKSDAKKFASSFSIIKQLMPALTMNIIIVHPRGVVFPRALYTVNIHVQYISPTDHRQDTG